MFGIPRSVDGRVAPSFRTAVQSKRTVDCCRGVWIAGKRDLPDESSVRSPTVADRGSALFRCTRPRVFVLFPRANQDSVVGRHLDRRCPRPQQPVAVVRCLRFRALRRQTGVCFVCDSGSVVKYC